MTTLAEPAQDQESESLGVSSDSTLTGSLGATKDTGKRKPKKKSAAGKLWRSAMMLVRRVHLYSGIFMFPFVLLYGFSGWFFNHPGYFREGMTRQFTAAQVAGESLDQLPSAQEIAESVVDEMNLESFLIDGPEIKLTDEVAPKFSGYLSFTVNTAKESHTVSINPNDGSGAVTTVAVNAADEQPTELPANPLAAIHSVVLPDSPMDSVRMAIPTVLNELELTSGDAFAGRRSPNITFSAEASGVPCLVTYNLGNGSITSIRQDQRPELGTMDLMRRMHLARMYTPQYDIRWVWALVVDAMFVSMVFWGTSGLFMWWQVKRTRLLGGGVLVASIAFSAFMLFGMHDNLTQGGGRRGGGHGGAGGGRHSAVQSSVVRPQPFGRRKPAETNVATLGFVPKVP